MRCSARDGCPVLLLSCLCFGSECAKTSTGLWVERNIGIEQLVKDGIETMSLCCLQ